MTFGIPQNTWVYFFLNNTSTPLEVKNMVVDGQKVNAAFSYTRLGRYPSSESSYKNNMYALCDNDPNNGKPYRSTKWIVADHSGTDPPS